MAMPTAAMYDADRGGGDGTTGGYESPIQTVGSKTFILQNEVWTDTLFEPDTMETQAVVFLSDEYFTLLEEIPELAEYFALGDSVIVVVEGVAYQVTPE